MERVGNVLGALYAWSAAVFFGAVLLDIVYASLLRNAPGVIVQFVFGEVSDFLLVLATPTILTALAAIALSWNHPPSRNLFLVSLAVLSLEFVVPIALFPVLRTSPDSSAIGISPYLRLVPHGLASTLALSAFRNLFR